MVRHFLLALGVSALLLIAVPAYADCQQDKRPAPTGPQQPRPKFWQDPKLRQEIRITDQQSAAIEQIFSSSIQALRDAHKELDALEAILSRTIQENAADVFTVSQQVDKVEAARSAYNKARTLMLYRMNLLLSPEQRAKVKEMNDRYEEQRRKEEEARRKEGREKNHDPRH
jgi:Spy/CpxP family protein refolding chaperone